MEGEPVDLAAPDISSHRAGNTGIPWFTTRDSGQPGPHTMITALTHGNELCGAIVVDELLRSGFKPLAGRVTFGFLNVAAFHRFDPASPHASRFVDEDFNRLWDPATLASDRHSIELDRARTVRPIIDTADYLLDIHSMQRATAPLLLAGECLKSIALAQRVGYPGLIICDEGHAAGRRLRDYGPFSDPAVGQTALLVECGQHWALDSVATARRTVIRFLQAFGQADIEPQGAVPMLPQIIEVTDVITTSSDTFSFVQDFRGLEMIPQAGTLIGRDGGREIRTPYDCCILIMPGHRLVAGQTAVRLGRFVPAPLA